MGFNTATPTIDSIDHPTLSPIVHGTIKLHIGSGMTTGEVAASTNADFKVFLVPVALDDPDMSTNPRPLNVVGIDSGNMEIEVKYGGAYSGTYDLEVIYETSTTGPITFDTSAVEFKAIIEITGFSPTQGS
jgi:hypothetical protein